MVLTVMVPHYQCEICGQQYRFESDALECEAKGLEPTFGVGDTVHVRSTAYMTRDDPSEKLIPAKITKAFHTGHYAQYELEEEVQISSEHWAGKATDGGIYHGYCGNWCIDEKPFTRSVQSPEPNPQTEI